MAFEKTCQVWSDPQPHDSPYSSEYPEVGDHNYCRNPDDDPKGPWCFTDLSMAIFKTNTSMEHCSVPLCSELVGVGLIRVLDFQDIDYDDHDDSYAELDFVLGGSTITICTAFMVDVWTVAYPRSTIFNFKDIYYRKETFDPSGVDLEVVAHSSYTEYILTGGMFGRENWIFKTEILLFPLKWTRICVSLEAVYVRPQSGGGYEAKANLTMVVDGQQLFPSGQKDREYDLSMPEKDTTFNLRVGPIRSGKIAGSTSSAYPCP